MISSLLSRIRKPCGCWDVRTTKKQNCTLLRRDSVGPDYVEEKKRLRGMLPYWEHSELIRGLENVDIEIKDYYKKEELTRTLYYFCNLCGEPYKYVAKEETSREYLPDRIDEALVGKVPTETEDLETDSSDENNHNEELKIDEEQSTDLKQFDSPLSGTSSVKDTVLDHKEES